MKQYILTIAVLTLMSQTSYAQDQIMPQMMAPMVDPNARAKAELNNMLGMINNQVSSQIANNLSEEMRQALIGGHKANTQAMNVQSNPQTVSANIPTNNQNKLNIINLSQKPVKNDEGVKEKLRAPGQTTFVIVMKEQKIQDYNMSSVQENTQYGKEQDERNYIKFLTGQLQ